MSKRVMIIDDDCEFLYEMNEALVLNGYEVVAVNDASLVYDMTEKTKPDVILLDLNMPKKSGFEVALELKYFSRLYHIPIIGITGFYNDDAYVSLMNLVGIQKYLKKPINPADLISQIEGHTLN
jgi:DNA-binding response OmpR family regulator